MKDKQLINHITINTGNSVLVPHEQVPDSKVEVLKPLVIKGGGMIPGGDDRYRFLISSEDSRSCAFSIWQDKTPILMCGFQEKKGESDELWGILINKYKAEFDLNDQVMSKPLEPWLGVIILPTAFCASRDLHWIAKVEQCIAETWRRLPLLDRSPIDMSDEVMAFVGWNDIQTEKSGDSVYSSSQGIGKELSDMTEKINKLERDLQAKTHTIEDLKSKVAASKRARKEAQNAKQSERKEIDDLKHSLNIVTQEKTEIAARFQALSTESVPREIATLKTLLDDKCLEMEIKDCDHAKAIAESISHNTDLDRHRKYLMDLLRKHNIPFNTVFGHGNSSQEVAA